MTGEGLRDRGGATRNRGVTQNAVVTDEKLELARRMRQRSTAAEERAWEYLRNRRCCGLKFRRQQVLRGLIVDFYCAEKRLVIELDGEVHSDRTDYDIARDAVLAGEGLRVLRLHNRDLDRLPNLIQTALGDTA